MGTLQSKDGVYFLLRRLHSLTGIVPVGLFMIIHLVTNSSVIWGGLNARARGAAGERDFGQTAVATFQHEVNFINDLPLLLLIEIFGLWLPIAFHSVLGVYYATTGRRNTERYAYQDNWRYTLQRWTGYAGLLFIVYHVATLRWGWDFLVPGDAKWSHYFASSTLAAALRGSVDAFTIGGLIVSLLYFVGVTSLVYHFANGLWTAAITWGITVSAKAQQQFKFVCAGLGLALLGAGVSAVVGFALLVDPAKAYEVEREIVVEKYGEEYLAGLIEKYKDEPPALLESIRKQAAEPWPGGSPEPLDVVTKSD